MHDVRSKKIARIGRLSALGALLLVANTIPATAGDMLEGRVKTVSDGDTLVVGRAGRARVVQLAGIDAPELMQEFGPEARQFVRDFTAGKQVKVEVLETKSRESVVGRVTVDGRDLAAALIERGLAWASESSSPDLRSAEAKAKSDGSGLWASSTPTPPWEFRKSA